MYNKKHFKKAIHHLIIGVLLILKGVDKYSDHQFIGGCIVFMGTVIILYFMFDLIWKKEGIVLKSFVHLFEGLALFFTAYVYYKEGKTYLPYITWLASLVFMIWFFVDTIRGVKARKNNAV
jgi:hypothetical protein